MAMHSIGTGSFHFGIGPLRWLTVGALISFCITHHTSNMQPLPGGAHGRWKGQPRQSQNMKLQCPRCDVTREKQCGRNAIAYQVHLFCTWSYLWGEVGSSGLRCTRHNHKRQENPDHLQPDVTTTQVLYWVVSTHSLSVTTAQVLYRGSLHPLPR